MIFFDYEKLFFLDFQIAKTPIFQIQVTGEIVPFMTVWNSKQPFTKPNKIQDSALMRIIAKRMVEEASYEWASNTPVDIPANPEAQTKLVGEMTASLTNAVLGLLSKERKSKK